MSEWNGWKSHSSVDRDRKWKTFKFRPGIAYTICKNQFHLTKKRLRTPETGIKDVLEEMEHEFPFGKTGLPFLR